MSMQTHQFLQERVEDMSTGLATDFGLNLAGCLLRRPKVDEAAASRTREFRKLYNGAALLALSL
ncbi:hypothetical protein BDW66DRAFT_143068 [Aspergillus desertorum]